ncbi:MAG: hypothetical protein WBN90_01900 [Gammaproteobacteria bacterium]
MLTRMLFGSNLAAKQVAAEHQGMTGEDEHGHGGGYQGKISTSLIKEERLAPPNDICKGLKPVSLMMYVRVWLLAQPIEACHRLSDLVLYTELAAQAQNRQIICP